MYKFYTVKERLSIILERANDVIVKAYQKTGLIPSDGDYTIFANEQNSYYKNTLYARNNNTGKEIRLSRQYVSFTDFFGFVQDLAFVLEKQ